MPKEYFINSKNKGYPGPKNDNCSISKLTFSYSFSILKPQHKHIFLLVLLGIPTNLAFVCSFAILKSGGIYSGLNKASLSEWPLPRADNNYPFNLFSASEPLEILDSLLLYY